MSNAASWEPQETPTKGVTEGDAPEPKENWVYKFIRIFFSPNAGTIVLAIVAALVICALIVVFFDAGVQSTMGYFTARPGDFFQEAGRAFAGFFTSLIRGSIFDWTRPTAVEAFRPLSETLVRATPLIIAGLAISVSFTAGLFNIGVQGQLIVGAIIGGYIGFAFNLPPFVHLLVAIIGCVIGGGLWAFVPGFLKAKLGANEVIVTIMMNSIAALLLQALLNTDTFHGAGHAGKSMKVGANAVYPLLLGSSFRLHFGFLIVILACIFVWWLLNRSTFGFELRAAGANPEAAQTAGINVKNTLMFTLVLSGMLAGLAATAPTLGTEKALSVGMAGTIGFDAITVALLGKSKPLGVFFAGILFGALNAGGAMMQSSAGIPVDIVQVTQAIIVLVIAGSEAVRYMRERRKVVQKTAERVEKKDMKHLQTEGTGA